MAVSGLMAVSGQVVSWTFRIRAVRPGVLAVILAVALPMTRLAGLAI